MSKLTNIFISVLFFCFFILASCDRDGASDTRNIEGYWLYVDTNVDVILSDTSLVNSVRDYISKNYTIQRASYEFKSNKAYYLYQNYSEPLRGNFEVIDKNYFMLDDAKGYRRVVYADSLIYVMTNMKGDIANGLGISEERILKADLREVFKRGLPSNR